MQGRISRRVVLGAPLSAAAILALPPSLRAAEARASLWPSFPAQDRRP